MNNSIKEQFQALPLSEKCKQILLGGLLGDSSLSITEGYKKARYQFRHSSPQEEYCVWKSNNLQEIALENLQYGEADGASTNSKINFMSRACEELTVIQNIVSPNKSKVEINHSNKGWLEYLDERALLIWWLDDGSLVNNGRRGTFCCEGFGFSGNEILQDYYKSRWGLETSIIDLNRKNTLGHSIQYSKPMAYRLQLANSELRKLFDLILPLLETPSMLRKFTLRYNDPKYQERWISTMKEALPQFSSEIEKIGIAQQKRIADKKAKAAAKKAET